MFLIILLSVNFTNGQQHFKFIDTNKQKLEIPFQFVANLIIVKIKINNVPLNLVLDTGIKETLLLNLNNKKDSLKLKQIKKQIFVGVGNQKKSIQAVKTTGNTISINNEIISNKSVIYLITNENFKFSETLGIPIYGFIGGDLLKDFIVKINYRKQTLTFYKNRKIAQKKLKKYTPIPVSIKRGELFIETFVQFNKKSEKHKVKLLIDSGNSDAVWLFENKKFKVPKKLKRVKDFFGLGLNGEITGNSIKLYRLFFNEKLKFKNVYTALPDSVYYSNLLITNKFDGIIGSEILQRFYIFFDYKNKIIYLKKDCWKYNNKFLFNDSGIHLAYADKIPIKVKKIYTVFEDTEPLDNNHKIINTQTEIVYEYKLVNKIEINYIRPNSPADKAGFMKGDVLLKINGENVYQYKLEELKKKFFYKTGKNLRFLILRNNLPIKLYFKNETQF